jgi:hypothetical protein
VALGLVAIVSFIPLGPARGADRPVGPLSPATGAWFGGSVNQLRNDGVNGGMLEINQREAFLGRTYDVINRFYAFNVAVPTGLETWDVSMGRIPMITWGAPSDTIELRTGVHDAWLRQQADRFAAFGTPIFLRFFHEMEGDYRRSYVHSPADFIAAWRHVHDLFASRGATNVVWIWSPTAWKFQTRSPWPPDYYPGDAYVDWIAADGYNWYPQPGTNWRSWNQIFQPFYDWASTMTKPIMIAENGVMEDPAVPGRKAAWITSSRQLLQSTYPLIQAIMYFDTQVTKSGFTFTWPVDTTQSSYDAYRAMALDPYFNPPHGPADTNPPSKPGTPSGVSNSSSTIDLTWAASADDVSTTLTYLVRRDGVTVGSISSASTTTVGFTDTGLQPESIHTYTVIAEDASGNPSDESGPSSPIQVQAAPPPSGIFSDDFSAGFTNWSGSTGLTLDGSQGGIAPPSARAQVTNAPAWAFRSLGTTLPTACMSMNVNVVSRGSSFTALMRLRTAANGNIVRVFMNNAGVLWIKSDVSGAQRSSATNIGTGWHQIELCGTVGAAGTWSLYRDGIQIVNAWAANTGTTPVGRIEIGDTLARTFTANFDDVVVDQVQGP